MQNLIITNLGQELMAKLIVGAAKATFTQVVTSSHEYEKSDLENLTQLEEIRQTAQVSHVSKTSATSVEVLASMDNSQLTEGYYIRTLGLYAEDGTGSEILYGVSIDNENPDYMPAFAGRTATGVSYRLRTKVDNSDQITIEVNPATTPTIEQVESIERIIEMHKAEQVYAAAGAHGLRVHNEVLQYKNAEGAWSDVDAAPKNSLKLQIGGEKPETGPWIWFDTQMSDLKPDPEIVLQLTEGNDADVQAEVEQKNYNVDNGTTDENQITDGKIYVEVID